MKAQFEKDGTLVVLAENNIERFALSIWWKDFNDGEPYEYCFKVEIDDYLKSKIKNVNP